MNETDVKALLKKIEDLYAKRIGNNTCILLSNNVLTV